MTPIERQWERRVEALRREHGQWSRARDRRLVEYKTLWNNIRLKRKEYADVSRLVNDVYRHLYLIRKALGEQDKALRRVPRKQDGRKKKDHVGHPH